MYRFSAKFATLPIPKIIWCSLLRTSSSLPLFRQFSRCAHRRRCMPLDLFLGKPKAKEHGSISTLLLWWTQKERSMPKWIKFTCLISTFQGKSPTNNPKLFLLAKRSVYSIHSIVKLVWESAMIYDFQNLALPWLSSVPEFSFILEVSTKQLAHFIGSFFWGEGPSILNAIQ